MGLQDMTLIDWIYLWGSLVLFVTLFIVVAVTIIAYVKAWLEVRALKRSLEEAGLPPNEPERILRRLSHE